MAEFAISTFRNDTSNRVFFGTQNAMSVKFLTYQGWVSMYAILAISKDKTASHCRVESQDSNQ